MTLDGARALSFDDLRTRLPLVPPFLSRMYVTLDDFEVRKPSTLNPTPEPEAPKRSTPNGISDYEVPTTLHLQVSACNANYIARWAEMTRESTNSNETQMRYPCDLIRYEHHRQVLITALNPKP